MNLTINPIKFNNHSYFTKRRQQKPQQNYLRENKSLNLNSSLAFKNQILFKGFFSIEQRRELIKQTIQKNSLPIQPQALEFALFCPETENNLYTKYSKTGSKFFELFSRYLLHKNYPIKDEGELTDIIAHFIKGENKSRIINDFIPKELLPKTSSKEMTQISQARCLNALLGAIIYENKDGFKVAFDFLNNSIGENIFPKNLVLKESPFEKLAKIVEKKGHSWKDLYQETRFFNEQWHYRIHYKDIILSQATGTKHNHQARSECIKEAIEKIESGEINLDNATNNPDNLIYTNYTKPSPRRIKELEEFSKKWGLKFNNINFLHKAFLYGEMQDCSALAHCDTYEALEFVGDAVLGFCTHEILQDNLIGMPRDVICSKRHSFVKNKNLALVAEEMNLSKYAINRNHTRGEKRTADMFEALIGAIFMDGGADGINNVYKFLDNNFRDKICSIDY